eukprot:2822054-Prymnesium_polylepis.1
MAGSWEWTTARAKCGPWRLMAGLFEALKMDAQKLYNLCSCIIAGYNEHPYHSWIHACDVVHGAYWMLRQSMSNLAVEDKGRPEFPDRLTRTTQQRPSAESRGTR